MIQFYSRLWTAITVCMLAMAGPMFAQNSAVWEVWRVENPGKISDHTTDSVVVTFDTVQGKVNATIVCEARQAFGTRSTRRLSMRILNFTGTGQYTPVLGDAATYWENFSRDSTCGCIDNSANKVVINQWDTATRVMDGTFEFRCRSFIATSGDEILYRIRNGNFRWASTDKIVIVTDPKDTLRLGQITGSDTTINFVIEAKERDAPLSGVKIKVLDKTVTGSLVFQEKGTTDNNGKITYPVVIQRDAPAGDYELKFYGVKAGHDSSDTSTVLIRYRNRIWEYKCAGAPLLKFDAGEGKEWKPVSEGSPVITASGSIMLQDVFEFRGKVRINTTEGAEKIFLDSGKVYLQTVNDQGFPLDMESPWLLGSDNSMSMPDCTGLFNLYKDSIVKILSKKLFGAVDVSIEKFTFINRPTGKGIDIEGKVSFGALARVGCDPIQDPTGNLDADPARRSVTIGIALTTAGFDNLRIKVENLKATDAFCLKEFTAGLDNFNKTANLGAKATMLLKGAEFTATFDSFWKSTTGSIGVSDLKLDSLRAELELENCKPIPQTPFCFKTAKFSTSGWANATPAGLTLRLGAVVNSADQFVLDKAPWLRLLIDSAQIMQFEGTLQYTHPLIFTGAITSRVLRISKPFKSKPWQCEGTNTLTLDMNNRLQFTGTGNYFHLGADDYFVAGSMTQQIYWNPQLGYSGTATGTVRIPAPGQDLLEVPGVGSVLRFMKFSGWIPQTLGQASMSAILNQDDGFQIRGSVDVSQNPISYIRSFGVMSVKVKCIDGDWDVDLQQGMLPTTSGMRMSKGEDVQAIPAQPRDTIIVDGSMSRVFVMISGSSTAPVSALIDPSGTTHTATSADSSVRRFATPGNEMVQWTLVDPEPGNWVLEITDPKAGDNVEVMVQRTTRPFTIAATQNGRDLTATWEHTGSGNQGEVRIFLDENGTGYDGIYLGKANEQAGEFQYTIPDGMSECEYHVYAQRFAPGEVDAQAYATATISLNNGSVPQPVNVSAVSNSAGKTAVAWTVPPGTAISGFHISSRDNSGVEELIATARSDDRRIEIDIAAHESKTIVIRSFDDQGARSCPTTPTNIVTSVDESVPTYVAEQGTMTLVPNPAQDVVNVRYRINGSVVRAIELYDMMGQHVRSLPVTSVSHDDTIAIECQELRSGSYVVRLVLDGGMIDGLLHILR